MSSHWYRGLSLAEKADVLPLAADLHVHLLGTGDVEFWRAAASELGERIIEASAIRAMGIQVSTETQWTVSRLVAAAESFRDALEIAPGTRNVDSSAFSRRFVLRRWIAWNRPRTIADLILWNAERYCREGVLYVELSVGCGWFRAPFIDAIKDAVRAAEERHSVSVRFLAAFNRRRVHEKLQDPEFLEYLYDRWDEKLVYAGDPKYYAEHLDELSGLERVVGEDEEVGRLIVGFDVVGEERHRPYMPFLLMPFRDFAERSRARNEYFGFRLHLGEGIYASTEIGHVSLRLGEHYMSVLGKRHGYPLRVGHGLGRVTYLQDVGFHWRRRGVLKDVDGALPTLADIWHIPTYEVSLTSNSVLVSLAAEVEDSSPSSPLRALEWLVSTGHRVVLATDDPGILGVTLRSEFKKAIELGLIRDDEQLARHTIYALDAAFADRPTMRAVTSSLIAWSEKTFAQHRADHAP